MAFAATIRAVARGHSVQLAVLGEFQFVTETMHLHNGRGLLSSNDPDTGTLETALQWKGMQGLAQISNLGASKIGSARQVVCTLDAEDAVIKEHFADQQREVKGRKFRFWGQFYDEDASPLDPRFHIYTGTGDRLRMNKSGPSSRSIELMLEDKFVRRRRSANAMVTQTDQKVRDPVTSGFIYVNQMVDQTLNLFDAGN